MQQCLANYLTLLRIYFAHQTAGCGRILSHIGGGFGLFNSHVLGKKLQKDCKVLGGPAI